MKNTTLTATKEQKNSLKVQQEIVEFLKKKLHYIELVENDVQDFYYCKIDANRQFDLTFEDNDTVEILYKSLKTGSTTEWIHLRNDYFIKYFNRTIKEITEDMYKYMDCVDHTEIRSLYRDVKLKTRKLKQTCLLNGFEYKNCF